MTLTDLNIKHPSNVNSSAHSVTDSPQHAHIYRGQLTLEAVGLQNLQKCKSYLTLIQVKENYNALCSQY